jgi:4-hydroxybenzoate polyprenyltransferase
MNRPAELWRAMRPQHWLKNVFVFAGLLFGRGWQDVSLISRVVIAAVAFCFTASGVYIINDIVDRDYDRRQGRNRDRPLAAGTVSVGVVIVQALALWAVGLGVGAWASGGVFACLIIYVLLNLAYSFGLKRIVIVDVFIVAAGFMLRLLAGTAGVGIPPSRWLLVCGLMLTLFLGFAKRRAEISALSAGEMPSRAVLGSYRVGFLDMMLGISAANVIMSYSLYTVSVDTVHIHRTEKLIYTVPFVLYGVCRYIYLVHHAKGGDEPVGELTRDPHLLITMAGWLLVTLWLVV